VRTTVEDRTVFIFLSGAKKAVMRATKRTVDTLKLRREAAEAEKDAQNGEVSPEAAPFPANVQEP